MIRCMLDLETLGDTPRAAIIQIGAVLFTEYGLVTGERFLRNVDFNSALKYGEATGATVAWWFQQTESARLRLFDPEPVSLPVALSAFYGWWSQEREIRIAEIWSHHSFDAVVLTNAYRALGKKPPFGFRMTRDLRTLAALHPPGKVERAGVHHHAIDDCEFQVQLAVKSLRQATHCCPEKGQGATHGQER